MPKRLLKLLAVISILTALINFFSFSCAKAPANPTQPTPPAINTTAQVERTPASINGAVHTPDLPMPTETPVPTMTMTPTETPEPLPEVVQWSMFEEVIQLSGTYTDEQRYQEIDVTAEFVGPDGSEYPVYGFWDGGDIWRVRFAPTLPGEWTYAIEASDAQGELTAVNGRFQTIPPSDTLLAQNPNYRGFLRLSANGRYLTYADGTPFFWMGDTAWRANLLTMSFVPQPDDAGPEVAEFPTYLANRQAKGFTVIQLVAGFPTEPERINEAGPTYREEFLVINPENFQWLDRRLQAILNQGMMPVMLGQWQLGAGIMPPEQLQRYWQYLIARTQAYSVIWVVTGEYGLEQDLEDVRALGQFIETQNSTNHLVTIHPTPNEPYPSFSSAEHFWGESWLDFHMQQTWDTAAVRETMLTDYGHTPPTAAVNAEAGYDGMRIWNRKRVRLEAWTTYMSGAAGYTYGANGIWNWNDGCCDDERDNPPRWYEAIDLPSSDDMQRIVDFFAPLPWWDLEPLTGLANEGYVLATPGERYIVYLPELPQEEEATRWWWFGKRRAADTAVTIDLSQTSGMFAVNWFNPATGETVAEEPVQGGREYTFTSPFVHDAVLHIWLAETS